jgi:toluene monooxygenase system ferredoxin subunit
MAYCRVLGRDELWAGEMRGVVVDGLPVVVIADAGGELHAFEDRCAHQRVKLSDGRLDGCELTCWAHGWRYDVRTGRGVNPTGAILRRIAVRIDGDGGVLVDVTVLP